MICVDLAGVGVAQPDKELFSDLSVTVHSGDRVAVVDAIVDEMTDRLDAAVADGRLTEDEAAEKLADAEERIADRVNNGRPDRGAPADD